MKKRILIVDDEGDSKLLQHALAEYEVRVETESTSALGVAIEFRPDLILLDLVMPEVHGSVLAENIRREERLGSVPFVLVWALFHSKKNDGRVVQVGDYPALGKPFSVDELKLCIKQQLSGKRPVLPFSPGTLAGS
jgi:two-component system response regulator RpaA